MTNLREASPSAPARGTRPRNRPGLIRAAAAELFHEYGYAHVSIGDVARSVNVTAPAIYRHYSSKADLLNAAVQFGLDNFAAVLDDVTATDLESVSDALAASALDHRLVGVLLQRESRNLAETERTILRTKTLLVFRSLGTLIGAHRRELTSDQTDLLAACAINALTSISFHHIELPREDYHALLREMAQRVVLAEPAANMPKEKATRRSLAGLSRSDQILDAAMMLFARDGYAAVTIDDIGAEIGLTGPTVYHYFPSKQELLRVGMARARVELRQRLAGAREAGGGHEEALRRISDGFVDFAFDQPDVVATLITENTHLSDADKVWTRAAQRDYIDEWIEARRTDDSAAVSEIKVQAVLVVASNIGWTSRTRKVPGVRQTVKDVCWALLR
jgi:AcrR family transcriptional regulator